jgi:hypothetical protein
LSAARPFAALETSGATTYHPPDSPFLVESPLSVLVRFFFELCLLRRAPQDLPASDALLAVVLVADLAVGTLLGATVGLSPGLALGEGVADVIFSLALLFLALRLLDRPARFRQTATALLGSGTLIGVIAIAPLAVLSTGTESTLSALAGLVFLAVIAWSILVTGHILRHCFDLRLGQGVVLAVAYHFLAYTLIGGLVSGS